MILSILLTLSILAGQLIKIPLSGNLGPTLLDLYILLLAAGGIYKLKFKLKKPPVFIIYGLAFAAIATGSLIFTPLHLTAFEYTISFSYTLRFVLYLLTAWIIHSGAFAEFKKNVPLAFLISGVGLAILGLLQFIFLPDLRFLQQWGWDPHYFRTVSTFLDPNFAGAYFVLTLLLLISCLGDRTISKLKPKVFYILFTIVYIALLTTFSRSSYSMFLISGLVLSTLKKSKTLLLATILLSALLLGSFYLYVQGVAIPRHINRTESAQFRLDTWKQGLILFQSHPILGVGFNAYRYALRENYLADSQSLKNHGSSTNDSSLLYIASTTGILGLLGYAFFIFFLIKSCWKEKILPAALAGLIAQSFFANSLFYPPILLWVVLIYLFGKDRKR